MKRARSFTEIVLLVAVIGIHQQSIAQASDTTSGKRFLDFTLGLGVDMHSAPSLVNYINSVAQPTPDQKVNRYETAGEFYAVPEFQVSDEWSVGIEYSLFTKSYSINSRSGFSRYDLSYQIHMPGVLVHYLVLGEGFRLKLGGGVGYHFVKFDESFSGIGSLGTLKGDGPAFKLDAIGNTKFDETFYGSIGVDLRWDFLGTMKRNGAAAQASTLATPPSMTFFNAGIKFGITFQII